MSEEWTVLLAACAFPITRFIAASLPRGSQRRSSIELVALRLGALICGLEDGGHLN
jgi:hypothetical protein